MVRASTKSQIKYEFQFNDFEYLQVYAKIEDVKCIPVGPDNTSELALAYLVVTSYIVPATLGRQLGREGSTLPPHFCQITGTEEVSIDLHGDIILPEEAIGEKVYCLWIAREKSMINHTFGLVPRCLDPIKHIYERIGIVEEVAFRWLEPWNVKPLSYDLKQTEKITVKIV